MNGEVVCSSHSIPVLTCTKASPVHEEKPSKLTAEGRSSPKCFLQNEAQRQEECRRSNTKDMENYNQCSPCWPEEQPPHLHSAQTCLRSPADPPLPHVNSLSHAPLQTNSSSARHGNRRRGNQHKVTGKKPTLRITDRKNSQNRKVTDYFPIRRSSRKSKTELKYEEKKVIDDLITNGIEEGMKVQHIDGKGRAVFATRCFQKGEYVVEYHGDLLQITDAKKREAEYAQNPATGCYMYYFQYLCKTYCVDATKETERMGRLINHSKNGNCHTKLHDINGVPHLILVASRVIDEGEELLYDYGDRSKASIAAHPWLKH
ncbi:hypothetical protein LDENG_00121600 [Lucifuga dentata]|nr:hypothetical protein LDENG_00121600 [Lucifuga dentata]